MVIIYYLKTKIKVHLKNNMTFCMYAVNTVLTETQYFSVIFLLTSIEKYYLKLVSIFNQCTYPIS